MRGFQDPGNPALLPKASSLRSIRCNRPRIEGAAARVHARRQRASVVPFGFTDAIVFSSRPSSGELVQEPGARRVPVVDHGADRHAQRLGGLFDGEPAEETQLDDMAGPRIHGPQCRQRLRERDDVDQRFGCGDGQTLERCRLDPLSTLGAAARGRRPPGLGASSRGRREKLRPLFSGVLHQNPDVRFVKRSVGFQPLLRAHVQQCLATARSSVTSARVFPRFASPAPSLHSL